jgi:hypothetical protein
LRNRPTCRASGLFLRSIASCSSVSAINPSGSPTAMPIAQ